MKRIFVYFAILLAAFITASCHHNSDEPDNKKRDTVERTVIVYMAAENTLSKICRYDSLEMVQGIEAETLEALKKQLLFVNRINIRSL